MFKPRPIVMLTVMSWCFCSAAALALEGDGITGTGEIKSRANAVEMTGVVSGDAELARDAIVKYQDNKRRVIDALEELDVDGLTVQASGFKISHSADQNQMQRMMGQPTEDTLAQVRVSEPLLVRIENIDQTEPQDLLDMIIQVIDAGKDAGLQIGGAETMNMIQMQMRGNQPNPLAQFKLTDIEQLQQQAYEQAMKNARANAERLAALAGVKLGRIVTVTETPATVDEKNPRALMAMVYGAMGQTEEGDYTSDSFVEIPVTAAVRVQFEIEH